MSAGAQSKNKARFRVIAAGVKGRLGSLSDARASLMADAMVPRTGFRMSIMLRCRPPPGAVDDTIVHRGPPRAR